MTTTFTMPAGTYWIGDLCYVMDDRWDEVCDSIIQDDRCADGAFTLKNGVRFAMFSTTWGDGKYTDREGHDYPVDSGSLGCVRVSDIAETDNNFLSAGRIVEFAEEFECSGVDCLLARRKPGQGLGVVRFGHVEIDADPSADDYDDREEG